MSNTPPDLQMLPDQIAMEARIEAHLKAQIAAAPDANTRAMLELALALSAPCQRWMQAQIIKGIDRADILTMTTQIAANLTTQAFINLTYGRPEAVKKIAQAFAVNHFTTSLANYINQGMTGEAQKVATNVTRHDH